MTPPPTIPLARPWYGNEEVEAVRHVLEGGWVVQGPEVAAFERAVADMHGMPEGVAVSSGTAGLHLIYLALGIGAGDVVLIPSFAWPSAANMAARVGAMPFFIDVDAATANMSAETLRRGLELARQAGLGKPKAVVVVHEFGLAAPMKEIVEVAEQENLIVIEDAACALGAHYDGKLVGQFGRAAVFSFHPRKSVSTGEGGVVVTREPAIAEAVRMLRNHGQQVRDGRREFASPGFNYRMTEIQAAIGRVQLGRFPEVLKRKRALAAVYLSELKRVPGVNLPSAPSEHTWQTFMITLESPATRDRVQQACRDRGIETGPGAVAGHTARIWERDFARPEDLCPVSTRLATCGLALPLHPRLTGEEARRVADAVRTALHEP